MRATSLEAYERMKSSGALAGQALNVVRALASCGPATSGEIANFMQEQQGWQANPRHLVSRRLPELRDQGVVCEREARICTVLKSRQIVWDVTGDMPSNKPPKKTRAQLLRENDELQTLVDELQGELAKLKKPPKAAGARAQMALL